MKRITITRPKNRTLAEMDLASAALEGVRAARTPEEIMARLDAVPRWVVAEIPEYREMVQQEILPAALRSLKAAAERGNRNAAEYLFDLLLVKPHLRNVVASACGPDEA